MPSQAMTPNIANGSQRFSMKHCRQQRRIEFRLASDRFLCPLAELMRQRHNIPLDMPSPPLIKYAIP
jgi:hypothetical protein